MMKELLVKEQPIVYHTLSHALKDRKIAHAYLFHGPKGTSKLDCAMLFAQSLICDHTDEDGFACESCTECVRIKRQQFADMKVLDGSSTSIKKENILKLQYEFHKTGLEHTGKKIYILNYAENATVDALNSLLKFLEEPSDDMIAILIVEQMDRLLPTIISRCQVISFRPLSRATCFALCKNDLAELDAYLLSGMIHNPREMTKTYESDEYQHAKDIGRQFFTSFLTSPYYGLDILLKEGFDNKKRDGKQCMRYFLEMQMIFFKDLIQGHTMCEDQEYQNLLSAFQNKAYPYAKLLEIALETRDKLWKSVNLTLLCDQMVYRMKEAVR